MKSFRDLFCTLGHHKLGNLQTGTVPLVPYSLTDIRNCNTAVGIDHPILWIEYS